MACFGYRRDYGYKRFKVLDICFFTRPQPKNWSSLEVSYLISNDDVELSMFVYPGDLERTNGFPVNNLEIDELTVNGVQILYQKFEDRTNSFRSLFTYNDYTYEVTVYSPTNADVLIEYLQRILSNQNQTSIDF